MPAIDDCLDESPGSPIHNQHVKHKTIWYAVWAQLKEEICSDRNTAAFQAQMPFLQQDQR